MFRLAKQTDVTDYSDTDKWAYFENEASNKDADVFFICPTVYMGGNNMPLSDEKAKSNFLGATNMEKGIYDENCRFLAPYYRQASLDVYEADSSTEEYFDIAYDDVKAAFEYYLKNCNNGRPIVLAGFSQGADMSIRLLKDCFADENVNKLLVACYAIGWHITEEEMASFPHLKFATGETDTGVIISFNSEDKSVTNSLLIGENEKTLAINPLNWKTDGTVADKSENKGACFTNYDGEITKEIPNLTGANIDSERGALKVTDIVPDDYPPVLSLFSAGVYHLYDYQFFYRNLQENVAKRIDAYMKK